MLLLAASSHGYHLGGGCYQPDLAPRYLSMDAKWVPKRKSYSPSWLRGSGSGDVYGEQQSEYEAYAKHLKAHEAGSSDGASLALDPMPPPSAGVDPGTGFGAGEATRDPEPTQIIPSDPKGKQTAIMQPETFAEYIAKRKSL